MRKKFALIGMVALFLLIPPVFCDVCQSFQLDLNKFAFSLVDNLQFFLDVEDDPNDPGNAQPPAIWDGEDIPSP